MYLRSYHQQEFVFPELSILLILLSVIMLLIINCPSTKAEFNCIYTKKNLKEKNSFGESIIELKIVDFEF